MTMRRFAYALAFLIALAAVSVPAQTRRYALDSGTARVSSSRAIGSGDVQNVGSITDRVELKDDFLGDLIRDEWVLLSGSSGNDPVVQASQQHGLIQLVTGAAATPVVATHASALAGGLHWSADQARLGVPSDLVFEARVAITAAAASCSVNIGLTDTIALEEPASIAGTTITTTASNAILFTYDTNATTDQWYGIGVKGDTDSADNGALGVAPTQGTFQVFRIVLNEDGHATLYIDGVYEDTISNAVTTTTLLSPVVSVMNTENSAVTVKVDYIYMAAPRN